MKYMIIGLAGIGDTHECAECGTAFHGEESDSLRIEPDGSLICPECRYFRMRRKYRHLRQDARVLRRAFAEIKLALLAKEADRWEIILGICEAYRGEFDVRFQ